MAINLLESQRRVRAGLVGVSRDLVDLLLPARCQLCDDIASPIQDRVLCEACAADWPRLVPGCSSCGAPIEDAAIACPRCQSEPPAFDRARALTLYEGKAVEAIQALKYHGRRGLAPLLGRWMAEALPAMFGDPGYRAVVPIPLHWRRRFWRGYNQAELLAQPIARAFGLPLELELGRGRSGSRQAKLGVQERRSNMAEAFSVPPATARRLAGGAVLLVDDVFTTGATTSACALSLKAAGVIRVDVLTLARTP